MCTLGWLQTLNCFYVWVCEGMCVSWWHFKWDQTPSDWKVAVSRKQMNWWIFVGSLTAIQACWGCTCVLGHLRTSFCFTVTAVETAGPGSLSLYPPPHLSRYADSTVELEMLQGIPSHQAFFTYFSHFSPHTLSCSLRQRPTTEDSSLWMTLLSCQASVKVLL